MVSNASLLRRRVSKTTMGNLKQIPLSRRSQTPSMSLIKMKARRMPPFWVIQSFKLPEMERASWSPPRDSMLPLSRLKMVTHRTYINNQ